MKQQSVVLRVTCDSPECVNWLEVTAFSLDAVLRAFSRRGWQIGNVTADDLCARHADIPAVVPA